MENAYENGERATNDTVKVKNIYTGKQLQVSEASIRHGLDGKYPRLSVNSQLGAVIGSLAKNAIPVNSMDSSNKEAEYTYPMVAFAKDSETDILAILHVDHYTDSIESVDLYDVVHSVNGRIRKNSTTAAMPTRFTADSASPSNAVSIISIADLLEFVKDLHPDILSESVLNHFGIMERPDGYYKDRVRFSMARSVQATDKAYMDLARRYESGDKSAEAELRKMVDAAAKRNGYSVKAFHGTTEKFNVFSRKQQGTNHRGYLEFGAGFYFTPSETEAEQWVKRGRSGQDGKAANVISVYLNPKRMLSADESVPGGAKYLSTWLSH